MWVLWLSTAKNLAELTSLSRAAGDEPGGIDHRRGRRRDGRVGDDHHARDQREAALDAGEAEQVASREVDR
jgi:hypothetical protein